MPASRSLPLPVAEHVESVSGAVLVADADGRIVFANEAAERLFGYSARQMLGEPIEMLVPEAKRDSHQKLRERFNRLPRSRPLVSGLELSGQRADGSVFRAEIALAPIQTDEGLFVASTVYEVPAELASGDFFRSLLDSAPDAMIITDAAGRIAIMNSLAEKMFGYDRKDLLGIPVENLLPSQLRERHVRHRDAYANKPGVRLMGAGRELTARRRDGSVFPVEISLSPVEAKGGNFVSTVIRDVTERKRLEDELVAARSEAERANRANSAFLAAASHDLRQPVQALSLLNGALKRTVDSPAALELIESQQESLAAMTNLLNSLLDISRLDAGAIRPNVEKFRVQRLFDRLVAEFGRQAQQKGLEFTAEPCAVVVMSDAQLLAEIAQNFVSNAIRYTESGSISLTCSTDDEYCQIGIVDTGTGIQPDELQKIFQEFHQVKAGRGHNEGFGLGLAIVRRLADLLGHEIRVESEPGVGSRFTVVVPLAGKSEEEPVQAADSSGGSPRSACVTGTVLVIEDDRAVARALELLLAGEGLDVLLARSAEEMRTLLNSSSKAPDLIVSDFHLGDSETGAELIAMVRKQLGRNIPAFIISGDTSQIADAANAVANSLLLSKPVDADRLIEEARHALGSGQVADGD